MKTTIERYNDLQHEILSNFALQKMNKTSELGFRKEVKKLYGFEKEFSWNILLNALYVIADTELAKKSFRRFQLQGPSRHEDIGERYLRLYGLLNAVYQEKLAIDNLLEIHKLCNKRELSAKLSTTRLIELRNKIGAHPSNYSSVQEDSEHKFCVYEISRPELEGDRILLVRNQNDFEKYDLAEDLQSFDQEVEQVLSAVLGKVISKLFKNQGKHFEAYETIKKFKNGAMLFGDTLIEFK